MKNSMTLLLISVTFSVTSQIKVFPGGLQSYGSTTSPASGEKHHFAGDLVVAEAGNTTTGCALLRANGTTSVSSASRPDFTWLGNTNTGIFHPASNTIGFTINGTEKFRMNSNGQLLNSNTTSYGSAPDYSWSNDPNTGMFSVGSDIMGFSTGGTERFRIIANGQMLSNGSISASYPDYSWFSDPGTGIFHANSGSVCFSSGGAEKWRVGSSGQFLSNLTSVAATPDLSWKNDANTGIFSPGADMLGISTGGTERARMTNNGNLLIGTTSVENARLNVLNGIDGGIYASCNYTGDWQDPVIEAETNRSNSPTYRSTLTGTGATFYVSGAGWIYSQGNYLGSDRNIKDDIHTIDSAGSKLSRITGVTYTLKKEKPALYGTANEYMGVIAQDVEAVAPQAVKTLNDGTKAVCYEMLVGLLIEGYKEQSTKIDKLQNDLNRCCEKADTKTERSINPSSTNDNGMGDKTYLKQNNPNPFNKETVIEYNIVESGNASILVFDMNGKLLRTLPVKIPGHGSITISANDFAAGMYYYSLIVNDKEIDTKKMILTQ